MGANPVEPARDGFQQLDVAGEVLDDAIRRALVERPDADDLLDGAELGMAFPEPAGCISSQGPVDQRIKVLDDGAALAAGHVDLEVR
jgi:hypothetical protein